MRQQVRLMAILATIGFLAGCNTAEVLSPPQSIGKDDSQAQTQPQGQAPQAAGSSPAGPVDPTQQGANAPETQFPQSAVTDGQQPQQQQPGQPQAPGRSPMLGAPGGVLATQKSIYQSSSQTAAGSVRFLPIIGAPLAAVTPLSQELSTEASARGLAIKPSSDATADHMLKGYFSAYDNGSGTTIVYVWDVLDSSGGRLNRLQGQENIPGKSTDPWSNVPPDTMKKIAADTISKYLAWKTSIVR